MTRVTLHGQPYWRCPQRRPATSPMMPSLPALVVASRREALRAGSSSTARMAAGDAPPSAELLWGPSQWCRPTQRDDAPLEPARARLGVDVAEELASRRRALTVAELVDRFMAEEIRPTRKARTSVHYAMLFRRHVLPALGSTRAANVTRSDVAKLHRAIGVKTPVTANQVVTLLSGLFSWAGKAGEVPEGFSASQGRDAISGRGARAISIARRAGAAWRGAS